MMYMIIKDINYNDNIIAIASLTFDSARYSSSFAIFVPTHDLEPKPKGRDAKG